MLVHMQASFLLGASLPWDALLPYGQPA